MCAVDFFLIMRVFFVVDFGILYIFDDAYESEGVS